VADFASAANQAGPQERRCSFGRTLSVRCAPGPPPDKDRGKTEAKTEAKTRAETRAKTRAKTKTKTKTKAKTKAKTNAKPDPGTLGQPTSVADPNQRSTIPQGLRCCSDGLFSHLRVDELSDFTREDKTHSRSRRFQVGFSGTLSPSRVRVGPESIDCPVLDVCVYACSSQCLMRLLHLLCSLWYGPVRTSIVLRELRLTLYLDFRCTLQAYLHLLWASVVLLPCAIL
jgi:hypothetical protein